MLAHDFLSSPFLASRLTHFFTHSRLIFRSPFKQAVDEYIQRLASGEIRTPADLELAEAQNRKLIDSIVSRKKEAAGAEDGMGISGLLHHQNGSPPPDYWDPITQASTMQIRSRLLCSHCGTPHLRCTGRQAGSIKQASGNHLIHQLGDVEGISA